MKIVKNNSLKRHSDKLKIDLLLSQAELAINTWQNLWSPFLSAPLKEELLALLKPINDLQCFSFGGFEGAERHRICFTRTHQIEILKNKEPPILGIGIKGNFLFDKAKVTDFRYLLEDLGAQEDSIGDIWLTGDRGAQAICTPEIAKNLNHKESSIRDVQILCEKLEIEQLQIPLKRIPKRIKTVEASTRIDAISSAGFGLSRAKIVRKIKEGQLRLNWKTISTPSKSLVKGDRIKLENKGSLEVLNLELTKKDRWRIELLRH